MIVIQKSDLSYEDLDKFLKSIKYLENNIRENPDKFNMELNNELREIYHILYLVKKQNPHINLKSEINKILNIPNYDGIIGYFIHNNKAIFYVKYGDKIYIPHYNVIFLASMFLEHNVSVDNVKLSIAKEQRGTLYIRVISPELKKRNFYYLLNGKYKTNDSGYLMNGPRKKVESFLNIKILGIENNSIITSNGVENINPIGIVAKLAWSFNRWKGLSPDLKEFKFRDRYGFEFVKKWGYAHEFWNFNEDFDSEYYYGWIEGNPTKFREGLIIFISKNIEDGKWYFVGLYGKGKYLETPKDTGIKMSDLLPEKIIEHIKNNIEKAEGNEKEYLERVLSGEETYKVKICGEKEYSTVFDEEGYVEVPNDRISVGMAGFSYIGENNNIKPETIKEILIKAKNKHEELLKNENIDENRKKEIEKIIEKIDKVLKLYFGGDTIIDKILDKKGQIILYGVPGTGKTYLARKYVEEKTNDNKNKYNFVTFHQSYSYEDFIEGFRPKTNNNENRDIIYEVEDGIFKRMCILAIWDAYINNVNFYKVSLGEKGKEDDKHIFEYCIKNNEICIGFNDDTDYTECKNTNEIYRLIDEKGIEVSPQHKAAIKYLVLDMKKGDIVLVPDGRKKIKAIGIIAGNYKFKKDTPLKDLGMYQFRDVEWVWVGKDENEYIDVSNVLNNEDIKMFGLGTINQLDKNKLNLPYEHIKKIVIKKLEEHQKSKNVFKSDDFKNIPKYYLIIDEINRGNISNILGELITLLEKDKRLGEENEIITTLPYSKEPFAVPPNLYIIGTMNTADRSIALLDIALRRRFGFLEIEPNYKLIRDKNIDEINLAELLKALNDKIVKLKDRDHRIGHSYFLNVNNKDDLWFVWYYEIIPLLEEYFYGDFEGLKNVLGEKFVDVDNYKIEKLEGDEFITALKEIIQNS